MSKPQIIVGAYEERKAEAQPYRDLSTVMVVPTRGSIPARVVESYLSLMTPMNQAFSRIFVSGMEVGAAYNHAIQTILDHPVLSEWQYVLTVEEDNVIPPDGLIRLLDAMSEGDYAAIGGLYFTKGPGGQPMCYGPPEGAGFAPFLSNTEGLNPCNGLGQGFTLFRMDLFRDLPSPWFETVQKYDPVSGIELGTQDLNFFGKVKDKGFKVACDARVRVGHMDSEGVIW